MVPAVETDIYIMSWPGQSSRVPAGRCPFMWAQSLFIISKLLYEGFIVPSELDPLNRRITHVVKPENCVQVVVLTEDEKIQSLLLKEGISLQTQKEASPFQVKEAHVLADLYKFLGRSKKLGLTGLLLCLI